MLIYTAHKIGNINVTTMSMRWVHHNIHIYAANECDYASGACVSLCVRVGAVVAWTAVRIRAGGWTFLTVLALLPADAVDEDAPRPLGPSDFGFVVESNLWLSRNH